MVHVMSTPCGVFLIKYFRRQIQGEKIPAVAGLVWTMKGRGVNPDPSQKGEGLHHERCNDHQGFAKPDDLLNGDSHR